jgi:hypothetical protein
MTRVEWELYGETNVDQVTDKTNKGLNGIEKNAKRVESAFSMSVSSIFLRFLGPMALLQAAISWISSAIDESKQKAKDAMDLAVKGESMAVKAETSYLAKKYAEEDQTKKEKELAAEADTQVTERYLREGNGMKVMNKIGVMGWLKYGLSSYNDAAGSEDVQKAVQELAAEEMKKPGSAGTMVKDSTFKAPEGFGNVIGVGANPVLENMTLQLEVQRQMLEALDMANALKTGSTDFTKEEEYNPYGM